MHLHCNTFSQQSTRHRPAFSVFLQFSSTIYLGSQARLGVRDEEPEAYRATLSAFLERIKREQQEQIRGIIQVNLV